MRVGPGESLNGRADAARFVEMYDRHFGRIFNYVLRRLSNATLAEDIAANVFYKALRFSQKLTRSGRDPLPWLYTVATNEVNSYLRKRKEIPLENMEFFSRARDEMTPDKEAVLAEEAMEKDREFARVRENIMNLREEYQTVLSLRYFEKLSYAEMAKVLGGKEGALRVRVHRALQALKRRMGGVENG